MTELLARWRAAVDGAATASAREVDLAGRDLLARWEQPHRRYHTLDHLVSMLAPVDRHADLAADPTPVRLAAWFHDAVYDPRAGDNEERSADVAEQVLLRLGVAGAARAEVTRLVRLTATHDPQPGDRNGALLCDADLAILASDEPTYHAYAEEVRAEYAHVPDERFRAGRRAVLRHLLELPALYRIVPHRAEWTARAHANLRRELLVLSPERGDVSAGAPGG